MQPPGAPAPLAESWQRLLARLIDLAIILVPTIIIAVVFTVTLTRASSYDTVHGVYTPGSTVLAVIAPVIVTAALYLGYEFLMTRQRGQTVGKLVMGIKIVPVGGALDAGGLAPGVAVKRAAVLWLPPALYSIGYVGWIFSIFYLLNVLWQLWDKPLQQCLHDKAANTIVVKIK